MSQFEKFCEKLRKDGREGCEGCCYSPIRCYRCQRAETAAKMLEHVYEVVEGEWPEIRDTLDEFAAEAMPKKQEPR